MDTDRLDPDLTEALARGREPRKLWPVLHAVEGRAEDAPGWWEFGPRCGVSWLRSLCLRVRCWRSASVSRNVLTLDWERGRGRK